MSKYIRILTTPCADASYTLVDEDSNSLGTGTIPSGINDNITAPNASYEVEYANGTPIESGTIPSGGGKTIIVPDAIICADATVTNGGAYVDTVVSGGTLLLPTENITVNGNLLINKPSVEDYDVQVVDSDDNPIGVISGGKVVVSDLPCSKELDILVPYSSGDGTATFTIVADSDGTITTEDTTGLTNVTYEVNSVPTTLPFTLAVGDVLTINFDTASADGVIKLEGTYA